MKQPQADPQIPVTPSPFASLPPFVVHCLTPGCTFTASGRKEAPAMRGLAAHVVAVHFPATTKGAA